MQRNLQQYILVVFMNLPITCIFGPLVQQHIFKYSSFRLISHQVITLHPKSHSESVILWLCWPWKVSNEMSQIHQEVCVKHTNNDGIDLAALKPILCNPNSTLALYSSFIFASTLGYMVG
jgi:hypothetical protein